MQIRSSLRSRRCSSTWLFVVLLAVAPWARGDETLQSPAELFGELFVAVQTQAVFPDSKTFVDRIPRSAPSAIMTAYRQQRSTADFDLRAFIEQHFAAPIPVNTGYRSESDRDVREHIDALWGELTRRPDEVRPHASLIALPYPYVVPGGRFLEIYYWDSYFTMLGLMRSGRYDLLVSMLDNFAHLIDRFGRIPNGNRTYYLSRSQPPFFAAMVELLVQRQGDKAYRRYLPQLAREYAFWMEGAETLRPGTASGRVIKLRDGTILNRYWDDRATPREESYREDVATASRVDRPPHEVYRNLRAAAESGWDFSSRWLGAAGRLESIRTVEFAPIDLNSLLFNLERTLAKAYLSVGQDVAAHHMEARAQRRRSALHAYFWNSEVGLFMDLDWTSETQSSAITAAALYPFFFGAAAPEHVRPTAVAVGEHLLAAHGLLTTSRSTGQQWDAPNGWAPLQWIAVAGLRRYGEDALAERIARRWIVKNIAVFRDTGKLLEKYNVLADTPAGGGEYPNQDGFGWTNGVLRELLALYEH